MIWPGIVFMWMVTRGLEYLDDPPDFELGLAETRRLLARLSQHDGLGSPDFERGVCGECVRVGHLRWRHGRFGDREGETSAGASFCRLPLCRACKSRRLTVGARVASMGLIEPPIPQPWVTPPLTEPVRKEPR
jgi:hypothetical protein